MRCRDGTSDVDEEEREGLARCELVLDDPSGIESSTWSIMNNATEINVQGLLTAEAGTSGRPSCPTWG